MSTEASNIRSVFLVTWDWYDSAGSTVLEFFARDGLGQACLLRFTQPDLFFFAAGDVDSSATEVQSTKFSSLSGAELVKHSFRSQWDLRRSAEKVTQAGGRTYEADISPCARYLMERGIFAQAIVEGDYEERNKLRIYTNPKLTPTTLDPELLVASLDIETNYKTGAIISIGVDLRANSEVREQIVFFHGPALDLDYVVSSSSEVDMLQAFYAWWSHVDPDVLLGWNVVGFDLRVLIKRSEELQVPCALGRAGKLARIRQFKNGGEKVELKGRIVLDGPETLRFAFHGFERWNLEFVAQEVLGTGKSINETSNRAEEILRMEREDPAGLVRYNLQDCILVSEIFSKLSVLDLCIKRSQITGLPLDEVYRSAASFDFFYLPKLHEQGYAASNVADVEYGGHAAGGYVITPKTGIHKNVAVLDFQSLYPSIIRTFSIDPLARASAAEDSVKTPVGYSFSTTHTILPDQIETLLERRQLAKAKGNQNLSYAIKILMNSFYGVMGSKGCRFYHPDLPRAITETGQWILIESIDLLREWEYEVLYGDTDSVFVVLGDGEGEELAQRMNAYWSERLASEFSVESKLLVEYERFYSVCVFPKARVGEQGAKKRYAGIVAGEGDSVEFVGLEAVRSDWTTLAKEFQKELYLRVLNGQEYTEWLRAFVQNLKAGDLDEQLVYSKRVRKPLNSYTKNVPPHIRAARLLDRPVKHVRYVMTLAGPEPVVCLSAAPDYKHYIEKQLKPIADSLLPLCGSSFGEIVEDSQLRLF